MAAKKVAIGEKQGLKQRELRAQGKLSLLLWRQVSKRRLELTLHGAAEELRVESPGIADAGVEEGRKGDATPLPIDLTQEEIEVVVHLRGGWFQPEIAASLSLGLTKVQGIVRGLKAATGSRTNSQLIHKLRHLDLGEAPEPEEH